MLRREEEFEEGDINGKCFFLIWKVVVFFVFVGNVYFIIIFFRVIWEVRVEIGLKRREDEKRRFNYFGFIFGCF